MSRSAPSPPAFQREASAADFVPGTNPRGELARADWRFLLPTLAYRRILLVGPAPATTLPAIATLASVVVVASADRRSTRRLHRAARAQGLDHVHAVSVDASKGLPWRDGSFDLVVAAAGPELIRLLRWRHVAAELARVVGVAGVVYLESASVLGALLLRRRAQALAARDFRRLGDWWLGSRHGAMRLAVPRGDHAVAQYFFDRVLDGRSRRSRWLLAVGRRLVRLRFVHRIHPHRALVLRRAKEEGDQPAGPLPYVTALAQASGLDASTHRPGLSAKGQYDSNKVAVFLFGRGDRAAELIVKMTRAPRFNRRLEAEYHALSILKDAAFVEAGTYPEVLFLGYHHGLVALGQKVLHGGPFRGRCTNEATCPFARDAIDWIIGLGAASVHRSTEGAAEVSSRLLRLFERFTEIYSLSRAEREFLKERIVVLGDSGATLPLVFRHGDPGTWNVFITERGRAAFLDWEASEPTGPPLWDLFEFLRSFGAWIARVGGERDPVETYRANFLAASPLSSLQAEAVQRYRTRVGVDAELVEPLFYTCWMHKALREARWTRRPLEEASYVSLLRRCIHERNSQGLKWLFT